MYFICDPERSKGAAGPDLTFYADYPDQAVATANEILSDMAPDDPALAFCIVCAKTDRIVHSGLCEAGRKRGQRVARPPHAAEFLARAAAWAPRRVLSSRPDKVVARGRRIARSVSNPAASGLA
jgi:hypothetical protein